MGIIAKYGLKKPITFGDYRFHTGEGIIISTVLFSEQ